MIQKQMTMIMIIIMMIMIMIIIIMMIIMIQKQTPTNAERIGPLHSRMPKTDFEIQNVLRENRILKMPNS